MKKKCAHCGAKKDIASFYKNNRTKDGLTSSCKDCIKTRNYERYKKNKEKINALARSKYWENKELYIIARKKYEQTHKEQISARKKSYRAKHMDEIRAIQRRWVNKKREQDEVYRIKANLRNYTRRVFLRDGEVNSQKLESIYGCSCKDLYIHLIRSWEKKYNKCWHGEDCNIDHIRPLCQATTIREVIESFHFSNLQLLTPEDNAKKGKV